MSKVEIFEALEWAWRKLGLVKSVAEGRDEIRSVLHGIADGKHYDFVKMIKEMNPQ